MRKEEIIHKLNQEVLTASAYFNSLPADVFGERSNPDKWSPAENVQHLVLSVRPLLLAFSLPKFILRIMFGKPNRPGRSYEQVVEKYKAKLEAGGRAGKAFTPQEFLREMPQVTVLEKFNKAHSDFVRKISVLREEQLDQYLLPHPLLGKLTLREMLYFTVYHVSHHHQLVRDRLKSV
ncbi:MAG: DinB family protein [Cyclobacteriaceae bacterium]|jgi:hypothetical protein|nr:DinB family protein [Cyclobacteriaceae bacterium]